MASRCLLGLCLVCALCLLGATPVLGDFYDDFEDGSYLRVPPGPWDPCDPNWSIGEVASGWWLADANDGKLRLRVTSGIWPYGIVVASLDEGDHDPNTSPYWFDDSAPHWLLSWVRWRDPNFGGVILFLHGDWATLLDYNLQFEWPDGAPSPKLILAYGNGVEMPEAGGGSNSEEPNMDRWNGFWMLLQFEGDGDPNHSYISGACWNGDKYDWHGFWQVGRRHILTGWPDANLAPYQGEGICALGSYFFDASTGPHYIPESDNQFDNIEARWGLFGDQFPPTTLTLETKDANRVKVEPNLPQYPKGMVVVLDTVCEGNKSFKKWKIQGPNDVGDPLYQDRTDTNEILYLTMAGDYWVRAVCKCGGGGIEPFAGMVLLLLGLGVVIRRLT